MIWLAAVLLLLVGGPATGYALLLFVVHRKYAGIPGPPRSSFISGNFGDIQKAKKIGKIRAQLFLEWHLQYGYVFVYFFYHLPFVACVDSEIINFVLLQHPRTYSKSRHYKVGAFMFGERVFGHGLTTETNYDAWAHQRTICNAAFHRKFLTGLVNDFNRFGDELVSVLRPMAKCGTFFDISKHFHHVTQDVLSHVAFGFCAGALRGASGLSEAVRLLITGIDVAFNSLSSNWSPFIRKERLEFKKSILAIRCTVSEVINNRLEKLKRTEEVPDDMLSIMLRAHASDPKFTMDIIYDNMITFYAAGQETSANTLSLMFMELGKHPDILAKMRREVDECIGCKEFISYDDVSALKYISMVIKETLRMYPIIPATFRDLSQSLKLGKFSIPAGATLEFSIYSNMKHPDFVSDPEKFDPERFDSQKLDRLPRTTYYPFSLGPRSCIGQNFAMIEMKILIAKLLQCYDCKMDKSQSFALQQSATLSPAHGIRVALTER